jgi:hypothetical protein
MPQYLAAGTIRKKDKTRTQGEKEEETETLVLPQSDKDGYDCHGSTRKKNGKNVFMAFIFPCASVAIK